MASTFPFKTRLKVAPSCKKCTTLVNCGKGALTTKADIEAAFGLLPVYAKVFICWGQSITLLRTYMKLAHELGDSTGSVKKGLSH